MKHVLRYFLLGLIVLLNLMGSLTIVQAEIDITSFAPDVMYSVGNEPQGVSIADLNVDGRPDITVPNYAGNSVSVLANSGSFGVLSFASQTQFTVGNQPNHIVAEDLDQDGRKDLTVVNEGDDTISVLRNTSTGGSISFAPQVLFTTGDQPLIHAAGDLDGDGRPDLAIANYLWNSISVLRNTSSVGSISFASQVLFPTSLRPRWVALGDLDGDGRLDLATANSTGASISVLRNISTPGNISFALAVDFNAGGEAFSVAISDLDGDSRQDLAAVRLFDHKVLFFRNTGSSGTITSSSFAPYTVMTGLLTPSSVTVGDLDADAKPDVVVSNYGHNSVSVLKNNSLVGNITFAAPVNFEVGIYNYSPAIGDLNGDSKPDLAISNEGVDTVSVLVNTTGFPDSTITSQPANPTKNTFASFSFVSNEPTATFECSLDGSIFSTCIPPKNYSGLSEGTHTFQVRAVGLSGKVDPTPAQHGWIVDTIPPETTIVSSPGSPTNLNQASFSFNSPEAGASFECSLDGASFLTCSVPQVYANLGAGNHTFRVRALDLAGNFDPTPAQFSWIVDPTPDCQPLILTTNEDTAGSIAANCTDVGGTALSYAVSAAGHGVATVSDGVFHYVPTSNYFGTDSFTYTANDGTSTSVPVLVSVSVHEVNDVPSFTAGVGQSVLEDVGAQSVSGWATAISSGPANENGQTRTFLVSNNNSGLFSVQPAVSLAGILTFTPAANANGIAVVTVRLQDNGGIANGGVNTSAPQSFTITVIPVNDAPSFTAGPNVSAAEDAGAQTQVAWAAVISAGPHNEIDQEVSFLVSNDHPELFSTQPAITPSGTLTFESLPNGYGMAVVSVRLRDNGGTVNGGLDTSTARTFTITITPVNDDPVCQNVTLNTSEDTPGTTLPNCMDVDGNSLTYAIGVNPAHGTAAVVSNQLRFAPNPNYNGFDSFSYVANDGSALSAPATVAVSVGSANDLPTAVNDTGFTTEDTAMVIPVLANDSDTDGDSLSLVSVTMPAHGTAVIENNTVTYTPALNFYGSDIFLYTASDGQGGLAQALVTITITLVDDAPIGEADAYEVGFMNTLTVGPAGVLTNDYDVENDALVAVLVSGGNHGTLTLNPDGSFTYTPQAGYFGLDYFTYRCSDGSDQSQGITVTIWIKAFDHFLPLVRR